VKANVDQAGFATTNEHHARLWLADGYAAMVDAATARDLAGFSRLLTRRARLVREWQTFFESFAVVVMPVSAELPFANHLGMKDDASIARVWRAQMPQIGLPFLGLPALAVSTGLVGRAPVGVQIVNGRYREDPCLVVGEGGHRHRLARSDRHLRKAEALTRSMSRPCACCRSVAGWRPTGGSSSCTCGACHRSVARSPYRVARAVREVLATQGVGDRLIRAHLQIRQINATANK
jgi:Amidase